MKKAATIVALLSIIVVCAFVIHRNTVAEVDDGYVSARERAIIKKFDKDGDGRLSEEEQRAADAAVKTAEDRKREFIRKYDKDGDGRLSEEEGQAARAAMGRDGR